MHFNFEFALSKTTQNINIEQKSEALKAGEKIPPLYFNPWLALTGFQTTDRISGAGLDQVQLYGVLFLNILFSRNPLMLMLVF